MRFILPLVVAFGLAASAGAQQPVAIDTALVKKIESSIVMPPRANPLASYSRFYEITDQDGRRVVHGVYLKLHDDYYRQRSTPVVDVDGAFLMKSGERTPMIADGGCGIVETRFDPQSGTFVIPASPSGQSKLSPAPTASCHGLA